MRQLVEMYEYVDVLMALLHDPHIVDFGLEFTDRALSTKHDEHRLHMLPRIVGEIHECVLGFCFDACIHPCFFLVLLPTPLAKTWSVYMLSSDCCGINLYQGSFTMNQIEFKFSCHSARYCLGYDD